LSSKTTEAVINLQIEGDSTGVATGTVTANPVSNAQGSYGYGTCTVSTNYAVYGPHAGSISYDPDALSLQFDDGEYHPLNAVTAMRLMSALALVVGVGLLPLSCGGDAAPT
jgi:hypothetical protein